MLLAVNLTTPEQPEQHPTLPPCQVMKALNPHQASLVSSSSPGWCEWGWVEEEKCHKEVHTLLRDAVAQELGADPALGQPGSAAENRVLLLEPVRRETCHCSAHTPQGPQQPLGIWQ